MPTNLKHKFKPSENQVYGDFEICPLEAEREGAMQAACIRVGQEPHSEVTQSGHYTHDPGQ